MKVEKRRGGWFAIPEDPTDKWRSLSGPWLNKEAADFAAEEKYHDAHSAEKKSMHAYRDYKPSGV